MKVCKNVLNKVFYKILLHSKNLNETVIFPNMP